MGFLSDFLQVSWSGRRPLLSVIGSRVALVATDAEEEGGGTLVVLSSLLTLWRHRYKLKGTHAREGGVGRVPKKPSPYAGGAAAADGGFPSLRRGFARRSAVGCRLLPPAGGGAFATAGRKGKERAAARAPPTAVRAAKGRQKNIERGELSGATRKA